MRIRDGHMRIDFDRPTTILDIEAFINRTDELNLPDGAVITYLHLGTLTETNELSISWRIPDGQE